MGVYGNYINEEILSEQVILQEMMISKKDCQDPEIVKKILEKGFPSVPKAFAFAFVILTTIAYVAVGVITLGIGLVLFMIVISDVWNWYNDLDSKYKEKNLKKLKEKCLKIKSKCEKILEKDPNNENTKKLLQAVNDNLKKMDDREKQLLKDKEDAKLQGAIDEYEEFISWIEDPGSIGHTSSDGCNNNILDVAYSLKIPFQKIINHFYKYNKDRKDILLDLNIYTDGDPNSEETREASRMVGSDKILEFQSDDEYGIFINPNNGKAYMTDGGPIKQITNYDHPEDYSKDKYFIQADRILGYYILSEPPKGIKKKELKI